MKKFDKNSGKIAVVLAAGYSSRMEDFKSILMIEGKPAVEGLIDEIEAAGISRILLVTGHEREKLSPYIKGNIREVVNKDFDKGMMSSIKAAISRMLEFEEEVQGFLLFPVDIPLVKAEVIREINEAIDEDLVESISEIKSKNLSESTSGIKAEIETGAKIENDLKRIEKKAQNTVRREVPFVVATYKGKKGHPLYVPKRFFEEILGYDGADGIKKITTKYFSDMKFVEVGDERILLDMDTKEDYKNIVDYYERKKKEKPINELIKGRRIFLIRHGSIVQHEDKIFLGQTDVELSDKGKTEIFETSKKLVKYEFATNKVYTSPLKRATMSTEILKKELGFEEVIENRDLKEIALGEWDGKLISEIKEKYPDEYKTRGENLLRYKPLGKSENFYDLRYRVEKAVRKILEDDKSRDLVIVSHRGVINIIIEMLRTNIAKESNTKANIEEESVAKENSMKENTKKESEHEIEYMEGACVNQILEKDITENIELNSKRDIKCGEFAVWSNR